MPAVAVVPLDEGEDVDAGLFSGRPDGRPDLGLEGREPALRHSIVKTLTDPPHRSSQIQFGQDVAEHLRGVLVAAVGVEDRPTSKLAVRRGHCDRADDQRRAYAAPSRSRPACGCTDLSRWPDTASPGGSAGR